MHVAGKGGCENRSQVTGVPGRGPGVSGAVGEGAAAGPSPAVAQLSIRAASQPHRIGAGSGRCRGRDVAGVRDWGPRPHPTSGAP